MSNVTEKGLQEAKIQEKLGKKLVIELTDKGLEKAAMAGYYKTRPYIDALQNQIDSLAIGGIAVSSMFGDNEHISVSQKALTQAINRIWAKIADITGEVLQGISMTVTPSYYIGEDGCEAMVEAHTVDTAGIFEELRIYINDHLVAEAENVTDYTFTAEITETSIVRCEAKILGITYTDQQTVLHHESFYLGAGTSYTQIMNVAHTIPSTHSVNSVYCGEGNHIYVVIADSIREHFLRADMNGVEILFDEGVATVDGVRYRVFTSRNTYSAGTYNIDING